MKKLRLGIMGLLAAILLCGCTLLDVVTEPSVEWMSNWSFQKNEGTNEYILFFALKDSHEREIAAEANVEIRIINDEGETLYEGKKVINEHNFSTYTNQVQGEHYLAAVRIPASDVKSGKSANGTVYFTVYQDNGAEFDEANCEAIFCLPTLDYQIIGEQLPSEVACCRYDGQVQSKLMITQVDVESEGPLVPMISVIVTGEKTYGLDSEYNSIYDTFAYKLCDSGGYVVDTGTIFLNDLEVGDKFREKVMITYNLVPGEPYTIKFSSAD